MLAAPTMVCFVIGGEKDILWLAAFLLRLSSCFSPQIFSDVSRRLVLLQPFFVALVASFRNGAGNINIIVCLPLFFATSHAIDIAHPQIHRTP